MKTVVLRGFIIADLMSWLQSLKLDKKQNDVRVKITNLFADYLRYLETGKNELVKKYSEKDEAGNPAIVISSEGKKLHDVTPENKVKLDEEYREFMSKGLIIPVNSENESLLKDFKNLVLNPPCLFGPNEEDQGAIRALKIKTAMDYVSWAEEIEKLEI